MLALHAAWGPGTSSAISRGFWSVRTSELIFGEREVLQDLESLGAMG